MANRGRIRTEVCEQMVGRIQNEGVAVATAALEHGINIKTIYSWLSKKAETGPNILQMNKLRRENEDLKKFGIKPYRRRVRRPCKPGDLGKNPLNVANWAKALCPLHRNVLWASDFTYFWFHGRFWYLATVIDIFSREIVGISF